MNVILSTKRVSYNLTINNKVTVVRGNCRVEEPSVCSIVRQATLFEGDFEGIGVTCNLPSVVLGIPFSNWKDIISREHGKIFFLDSTDGYTGTVEFANLVRDCSNYFIIFTWSDRVVSLLGSLVDVVKMVNIDGVYVFKAA